MISIVFFVLWTARDNSFGIDYGVPSSSLSFRSLLLGFAMEDQPSRSSSSCVLFGHLLYVF
ncbi:hypothetical protein Plhal304r1_c050g0133171 [Plasmopara halstedii]